MALITKPLSNFFRKIAEKDIDTPFRHRIFLLILHPQIGGLGLQLQTERSRILQNT